MHNTINLISTRLAQLGLLALIAFSMTACQLFSKADDESMAEEPMMEETTEMVVEEAEPLMVSDDTHVVSAGESLWKISGLTSIYNDSFRWPLIYGRNKDIEDADLIFPGQELAIPRDLTRADIDAAVAHAKNRGAWSIGQIEESDSQYRANSM